MSYYAHVKGLINICSKFNSKSTISMCILIISFKLFYSFIQEHLLTKFLLWLLWFLLVVLMVLLKLGLLPLNRSVEISILQINEQLKCSKGGFCSIGNDNSLLLIPCLRMSFISWFFLFSNSFIKDMNISIFDISIIFLISSFINKQCITETNLFTCLSQSEICESMTEREREIEELLAS